MATYEYTCENNHIYVDNRSMTDADNVTGSECEICTKPLNRVYSSPAVQFKGPGFYSSR